MRWRQVSEWSLWAYLPVTLAFSFAWVQGILYSQARGPAQLTSGKEIFEAACVACHGHDGKGTPQANLGFEPPATFPDFTDCNATSREADADWSAIIHDGGLARGFSQIMPSFRDALTDSQIDKVIRHLRGFCKEPSWPPGELNLPRPLVTEKAFPEDEWVLSTSVNAQGQSRAYQHVRLRKALRRQEPDRDQDPVLVSAPVAGKLARRYWRHRPRL